jgi:hypothetical protein
VTRAEQLKFVRDLSRGVLRDIEQAIDKGLIPESWDGHELRCLLADKHEQSAAITIVRREPHRARAKDYENVVLVERLT